MPSQEGVAIVMVAGAGVLAAIRLDDQPRFEAGEIDDERRDRDLSAKPPAEAVPAQFTPQQSFGMGHAGAEVSRPAV